MLETLKPADSDDIFDNGLVEAGLKDHLSVRACYPRWLQRQFVREREHRAKPRVQYAKRTIRQQGP